MTANRNRQLNRIRLRHLTCLLEIERTGSARAAAQALCVTESAVSKTVNELEAELDVRLFERARTGMQLTDAGRRFARYARSAVEALSTGIDVAGEGGAVGASRVRIGAMPAVAASLLPAVLGRMLREVPGLSVEVISGSKAVLLEQLRKGQLSFVLGRLPPQDDLTGLSFEQLFFDRYLFAVRPGHPLAGREAVDLGRIAAFPLVMPSRDTVTWGEIQRAFLAAGAPMSRTRLETIYLRLSRDFVLQSDAVWACAAMAVQQDLDRAALVRLPVDTALLDAPVGLMTRPADTGDPLANELARVIRAVAAAPPFTPEGPAGGT